MPLARPLADWPDLICGPILRRVTPRSVAVFAAFKRGGDVTLTVSQKGGSPVAPPATVPTRALGLNLHVALVELLVGTSQPALAPNRVYEYQLQFKPAGATTAQTLKDLGVLAGKTPLGYEADALPTFSLPPGLADLRVMYGSCRKPHAAGSDALAFLDGIIADTRAKPLERPHQLLLGGDQIYADDVALALISTLTATAATLLAGWSHLESLPATTSSGRFDWTSSQLAPGPKRSALLDAETRLTSGEKHGHLLFLGEFYAMYLLAWSDALWPRGSNGGLTLPTFDELTGIAEKPERPDTAGRRRYEEALQAFDDASSNALVFAFTLAKVRRVLANVPTYMIFDDHEITDDWQIDRKWDRNLRGSAPTRQIVRNGLLAYAVFQDWGNHPERYTEAPAKTLLDNLAFSPGRDPKVLDSPTACDTLLDLAPARATLAQRMQWDFHVEGPEHVVIALDTRTFRDYSGANSGHAGLIGADALVRQLEARRLKTANKLPVIISAAPVLGHPLIEAAQEIFAELDIPLFKLVHHGRPVESLDYEAWSGHRSSFEGFLQRVAAFERAVVISGDVHYAFANHLEYFPDRPTGPPTSHIVQLCSSAFKNQSLGTHFIGAVGYLGHESSGWLAFDETLSPQVRADLYAALTSRIAANDEGHSLASLYQVITAGLRLDKPAVIPAGPWLTDQAYQYVKALASSAQTDWRYRVTYLRDTTSVDVRIRMVPWLARAVNTQADHRSRTFVLDRCRTVVGDNNLGALRFEVDASGRARTVVNRWYWQPVLNNEFPILNNDVLAGSFVMFSETRAPLAPPDPASRPDVSK